VRRVSSVWHVAREYAGIAEAGGVKDVAAGLARALSAAGVQATAVVPLYGGLPRSFALPDPALSFTVPVPALDAPWTVAEEPVALRAMDVHGVRILLVDSPRFADKRGVYTYTAADEKDDKHRKRGTGHWDFNQMNAILVRAALEGALRLDEAPTVFHCHDGHAALLPAMLRESPRYAAWYADCGLVVTIHNAGAGYHQEIWDRRFAGLLTGLSQETLEKGMLGGTVDPLLLAGHYGTLNTVSEKYAQEMLGEKEKERSAGLGRALRGEGIPLAGITNGVDPSPFDPRYPEQTGLPFRFDPSSGDVEGRRGCRMLLADRLGAGSAMRDPAVPLYAFIGRLTSQKGVDVLVSAVRLCIAEDPSALFVVLGEGEKWAEDALRALAGDSRARARVFFMQAYDTALSKLIDAASDFLLIPSVYEPCGLTDFHAQLLGSIPVVHRVGGLVKVEDGVTGFSYDEHSARGLAQAVARTAGIFRRDPALLARIRREGFERIFSRYTWERVLENGYMPLYGSSLAGGQWTRG
jgi:starch synthase